MKVEFARSILWYIWKVLSVASLQPRVIEWKLSTVWLTWENHDMSLLVKKNTVYLKKKRWRKDYISSEFVWFYFFDARWKLFLWWKGANLVLLGRYRGWEQPFVFAFWKQRELRCSWWQCWTLRDYLVTISRDIILNRNSVHLKAKMRNDWEMTTFKKNKRKQSDHRLYALRIKRKNY